MNSPMPGYKTYTWGGFWMGGRNFKIIVNGNMSIMIKLKYLMLLWGKINFHYPIQNGGNRLIKKLFSKGGEKFPPSKSEGQNKKQKLWTNTHPKILVIFSFLYLLEDANTGPFFSIARNVLPLVQVSFLQLFFLISNAVPEWFES